MRVDGCFFMRRAVPRNVGERHVWVGPFGLTLDLIIIIFLLLTHRSAFSFGLDARLFLSDILVLV